MDNELKTELDLEKAWASMAEGQQFVPGLNPNDDVGEESDEQMIIHKVDELIKHYIFWENSYQVNKTISSILARRMQRRQSLVDHAHMILGNYWHILKEECLKYIHEADPSLIQSMKRIEPNAELEDLTDFDKIVTAKVTEIIKKEFPEALEGAFI